MDTNAVDSEWRISDEMWSHIESRPCCLRNAPRPRVGGHVCLTDKLWTLSTPFCVLAASGKRRPATKVVPFLAEQI